MPENNSTELRVPGSLWVVRGAWGNSRAAIDGSVFAVVDVRYLVRDPTDSKLFRLHPGTVHDDVVSFESVRGRVAMAHEGRAVVFRSVVNPSGARTQRTKVELLRIAEESHDSVMKNLEVLRATN